ncbi:MAG: class II fructose-bisphosphate aldolase [Nitrospinota bacterium]|nr:class II fructose-bisphosphate aldolase [Nitrospinota bacterium]
MLFSDKDDLIQHLKGCIALANGSAHLENEDKLLGSPLDILVLNSVLNPNSELRGNCRHIIKSVALELGIIPASIQSLYEARGRGENKGYTVPALNIRGLPYEMSRAIFRTAKDTDCGAFIFEIAKSEIGYTLQRPHELMAVILGAGIKERFRGPVFVQGDHFQINPEKFHKDAAKEVNGLKTLINEAISAGFYNIDIDTSTLVTLEPKDVKEQQKLNYEVGAELTSYVREIEPEGITVSVGGEIGEVGKENSNEAELRAYMDNFNEQLAKANPKYKGISKISIQTGTSHGGVPLPDGTVAEVQLDFETLENLSRISREHYHLAGAVQHGASTLPAELFHKFPELETAEIHLATDFQNMIYDSSHFPSDFKKEIYDHLRQTFADEKKPGMTDEQFIYKTRKKGFGPFRSQFWNLSNEIKAEISRELEGKFHFLFDKLNAQKTVQYIKQTEAPRPVSSNLETEINFA